MKDGDRQLDDEDLKRSHRLDLSELKAHLVQYVQPLVSEKNLHFRYSWENMTASVVEADSEKLQERQDKLSREQNRPMILPKSDEVYLMECKWASGLYRQGLYGFCK